MSGKSTAKQDIQTRPATVEAEREPVKKIYPKIGDIECPKCERKRSDYLGPIKRTKKEKDGKETVIAEGEKRSCRACKHKWIRPISGEFE